MYLPLCGLILSAAFTSRQLANQLLGGNDLSYGIYIYHMPVANAALYLGLTGNINAYMTLAVTVIFAAISWWGCERPALRLKPKSLVVR